VNDFITQMPSIIQEAAKSNLGIFALMTIAVSFLAFYFFRQSSEKAKIFIFVLMLLGMGSFGYAMFHNKHNPKEKSINIEGTWFTPYKDLIYKIKQDGNRYSWSILGKGVMGNGKIIGNTLISNIEGKEITYMAQKTDSERNPLVLSTTVPEYATIILFRSCNDFKSFINKLANESPEDKILIHNFMQSLPNPTCPNVKL